MIFNEIFSMKYDLGLHDEALSLMSF